MFDVISHARAYLIPAVLALFSAAQGSAGGMLVAVLIFAPSFLISVFRYFTLRYAIHTDRLIVTEGLLFRRLRTVPVNRIQNIDLLQNILHRMLDVAEVRVETAGGNEPEATLRVLSMSQVAALRTAIFHAQQDLQLVSGEMQQPAETPAPVGDATGIMLLEIPIGGLIRAGLASNRGLLIIGVVAGLAYQFDLDWRIDLKKLADLLPHWSGPLLTAVGLFLTILLLFMFLKTMGAGWYVLRFYGYRLERFGEDLRVSCGLLTKLSATVPRRRIQFISIHQNLFLRWMGFAAVRIETAGGAGNEGENASQSISRRWFIPVAPIDSVPALLEQLRPGLDWKPELLNWQPVSSRATVRLTRFAVAIAALILVVGIIIERPWGWIPGVLIAPWLVWWARKTGKSMRYARTEYGVAYRSGILYRKTSVTFFDRIQTLWLSQSPFDRRWRMAKLSVDTAAAGPADHLIQVPLLEVDFAEAEFDELIRRTAVHQPKFS
jgi:putative membrane protein